MGKQQKQLLSKEVLDQITEHAAKVAMETYNKQKDREEKEKFDRRLNNTRLLLEHYRDFSDYGDKAIYRIMRTGRRRDCIIDMMEEGEQIR